MYKRKKIDKRKKAFLKAFILKSLLMVTILFIAFIALSASCFLGSLLAYIYS